jgi:hypothetical protein
MPEPRITFEERGLNSVATYRFYDDRIEHDWKELANSGREIYPASQIAGRISETTTIAYGVSRPLGRCAIYLIVGLVLHFGFDSPVLRWASYALYALAGISAVFVILGLKKDTWLYVKKPDGNALFSVREKGLCGITRDKFVHEIQRYANKG